MLRRRPKDWPQILQKLKEDDALSVRPDSMRDVHFGYRHEWDVFQHGPLLELFGFRGRCVHHSVL